MISTRYINAAKDLTWAKKHYFDKYVKEIEAVERQIDKEIDDAMRDAQLPIEDEMLRIFEEQEEEVFRNLDENFRKIGKIEVPGYPISSETRAFFLTADSLLDFSRWIGETASRLAGYVRGTMQSGWCMGLALLGKECATKLPRDMCKKL